jgi:hypothetical protein
MSDLSNQCNKLPEDKNGMSAAGTAIINRNKHTMSNGLQLKTNRGMNEHGTQEMNEGSPSVLHMDGTGKRSKRETTLDPAADLFLGMIVWERARVIRSFIKQSASCSLFFFFQSKIIKACFGCDSLYEGGNLAARDRQAGR